MIFITPLARGAATWNTKPFEICLVALRQKIDQKTSLEYVKRDLQNLNIWNGTISVVNNLKINQRKNLCKNIKSEHFLWCLSRGRIAE